ncbi:flagellar basal body-associated FliL family protein [Endozoicomonas ascidiicola]|uniref:flagellar basal body-associated FliL family protein n=1 Tax=Endozoicomonas ascidiicola TaxID=1698521 RepID=UPI00082C1E9D|nr:flagellar basal body-associated FliL family protein [Endozoicomonas ascidiicola]
MAEGSEKKSGKGMLIVVSLLFVIVLAAAGGAAWFFMQSKETEQADNRFATPHFMKLEPFVISLKSQKRPHYLQIKLSLMSRDPEAVQVLEAYRPMVRNELVRYLNTLTYTEVLKKEAPDVIREASMEKVNGLLEKEQIKLVVDDLIITDLVVQ